MKCNVSFYTGLTVNNPTARLPYSKMEAYGISMVGLPDGKILKHPSSYGPHTLLAILERKESIQLKGMHVANDVEIIYGKYILLLFLIQLQTLHRPRKKMCAQVSAMETLPAGIRTVWVV